MSNQPLLTVPSSKHFGLDDGAKLDLGWLQGQLHSWCLRYKLEQIVVPYNPVGVLRDVLQPALSLVAERGLRIAFSRLNWDEILWPCATHGYHSFKKTVLHALSQCKADAGKPARQAVGYATLRPCRPAT